MEGRCLRAQCPSAGSKQAVHSSPLRPTCVCLPVLFKPPVCLLVCALQSLAIVMEYAAGGDMFSHLRDRRWAPPAALSMQLFILQPARCPAQLSRSRPLCAPRPCKQCHPKPSHQLSLCRVGSRLLEAEARWMFQQLAIGLAYCHDRVRALIQHAHLGCWMLACMSEQRSI